MEKNKEKNKSDSELPVKARWADFLGIFISGLFIVFIFILTRPSLNFTKTGYAAVLDVHNNRLYGYLYTFSTNRTYKEIILWNKEKSSVPFDVKNYCFNVTGGVEVMSSLVEEFQLRVPTNKRHISPISVYFSAAQYGKSTKLVQAFREYLKTSQFQFDSTRENLQLQKQEKQICLWFSVNFLMGRLTKPKIKLDETLAVLKLGATSMDLAFTTKENIEDLEDFHLKVQDVEAPSGKHRIFFNSTTDLGKFTARKVIQSQYGNYSYKIWSAIVRRYVEDRIFPVPGLDGKEIFLTGAFFDIIRQSALFEWEGGETKVKTVDHMAKIECFEAVGSYYYCMDLLYVHTILKYGLGLRPSTKLYVYDKVDGYKLEYGIGKAYTMLDWKA